MVQRPPMTLTATVLDAPDWVTLRPPGGAAGLSFQTETAYAHAVAAGGAGRVRTPGWRAP
jgi:hypothetical protein